MNETPKVSGDYRSEAARRISDRGHLINAFLISSLLLMAVFALGCTSRAPLPPPQRPLTTTPDDSFRASVPPPEPGVPPR